MKTTPPKGIDERVSLRFRHFISGFVLGFMPILLLGLYRDNDTEMAFIGAGIVGLIFGFISAIYGRSMLKFLIRFFSDGAG